jgi:23S rRNA (cytidine1920-2'-O)/16S rRNA (cytidine1409-2'-O)-methyltransferase
MDGKQRADTALVERGLAPSREKAQALIMSGSVYVREVKVLKPSEKVAEADELTVRAPEHPYVGRGALKLEKALRVFRVDPAGMTALDIGAATGGFTDVLLRACAERVYAVDVGYGQLDWKIRSDPRVTVLERTNARYLTREQIGGETPGLTVMDVSFISVRLILPVAAELMERRGLFCILIKPQFEAGRERVGKKGVVRDPAVHIDVARAVRDFTPTFGYRMTAFSFSPLKGPEGNIEYLARLDPERTAADEVSDAEIAAVVAAAHEALD